MLNLYSLILLYSIHNSKAKHSITFFKSKNYVGLWIDLLPVYLIFEMEIGQLLRVVLLLSLGLGAACLARIDGYDELMHFHEENSHLPILHVYYNRHFSASKHFPDFLEVLEETEFRCGDYARFVLTDCEELPGKNVANSEGQTFACDQMRRNKDSRMIFGYIPDGGFVDYAGKKMQNPPTHRQLTHPSDVFTVSQLEAFVDQMVPDFFQELSSLEEYQQWLTPRYAPKLLFASRDEGVPLVVRKLGVFFFLRFDLAFLSDLTESVTKELNLTSFPRLLVLEYNYAEGVFQSSEWEGKDFSARDYHPLRQWLQPLALVQPRNDLLFHKMKVGEERGVVAVGEEKGELQRVLDRSEGWTIISTVIGEPLHLRMLREKYGRFFEYIHLQSGNETQQLQLYDPEKQQYFELPAGQIRFKAIGKDDFVQHMASWIRKGFVFIGARERYGHYCSIAQASLFRGLTQCLILKDDDYEATSALLKMNFERGFACYETIEDKKEKIIGRHFNTETYQDIFRSVEYLTRLKSKEIVEDFMAKPIKPLPAVTTLAELCASPGKKCALLLTPSGKTDRTAYDYLKEVAVGFINEYLFFEVELQCNSELETVAKKSSLLVYHPRNAQYVALKAKLSKTTFQKFLKANLSDNKKLPLHSLPNEKIQLRRCSGSSKAADAKNEEEL